MSHAAKAEGWGRKTHATWTTAFLSLVLVVVCPVWMVTNWIGLEYYDGSLQSTISAFFVEGPRSFIYEHFPRPTTRAFAGYAAWLLLQAFLFTVLPGPRSKGQLTPAGHILTYTTNGLLAYGITHALYVAAVALGILDPAIIARNWEGLLVALNAYGLLLSASCQIKGHLAPSYPGDRKFSGSLIFDFFVGVELNPRFGEHWDIKLFHNGRPGIVAWTLIDLSFIALQYQTHGYVSNSIVIVTLFHFIYVIDFFCNEDWYLRTIDINHDFYGFYLAWGSIVLLPNIYTVQVQFLARYPINLSVTDATIILALGLSGYAIFRSANHQKNIVRRTNGDCTVWGKSAQYLRCKFKTEDGKMHESLLLTSGWWGFSRHANYLGDLMQAFAMCATCGFTRLLPWSYFLFISAILFNRTLRDEKHCERKYGANWKKYCERVKYRLIPGVL